MALATQCPHCKTTFKVAHDQLKLRSGLVRCGACKQIFNGIEHLVPPDQPAATSAKPSPPPAAVATPQHVDTTIPAAAGIAGGNAAVAPPAPPSAIDALEFIPVDDPETQTRVLSAGLASAPEPAESELELESAAPDVSPLPETTGPAAETDDDPLTRMTLVNFSVFNEDLNADLNDEAMPRKDAVPADAQPAFEGEIWPDTQDGLPDSSDLPGEIAKDALSRDTLAATVTSTDTVADGVHPAATNTTEHVAAAEPDVPAAAAQPVAARASADAAGDDIADHTLQEVPVTDDDVIADDDDDVADDDEPAFVRRGRRRQRWGRAAGIFMAIASVLLLATALAQAAYAFRDQLAARFPQAKPTLIALCELAGCQVSLPAQIEQVSIESNELQAQASNKNIFMLSLLLHNRSAVAQAWPHVELTLNDKNGHPLLRRALAPRDYLPSDKLLPQGLAARSEQAVAVSFELRQLQASDYRVYLFYP